MVLDSFNLPVFNTKNSYLLMAQPCMVLALNEKISEFFLPGYGVYPCLRMQHCGDLLLHSNINTINVSNLVRVVNI